MNAETIIREVKDNRIVAILRGMPEDKLIATAEALYAGGIRLIEQAGAEVAAVGIVIEKSFQPGRGLLEEKGYKVFSLARVAAMSEGQISFVEE